MTSERKSHNLNLILILEPHLLIIKIFIFLELRTWGQRRINKNKLAENNC